MFSAIFQMNRTLHRHQHAQARDGAGGIGQASREGCHHPIRIQYRPTAGIILVPSGGVCKRALRSLSIQSSLSSQAASWGGGLLPYIAAISRVSMRARATANAPRNSETILFWPSSRAVSRANCPVRRFMMETASQAKNARIAATSTPATVETKAISIADLHGSVSTRSI